MTKKLCNPVELWHSLQPQVQQRLGALAIANELAMLGSTSDDANTSPAEYRAFEICVDEAEGELTDLIIEHLPDAFQENGEPKRPDLNILGIRQCTACGCTDHYGCEPACAWASAMLCSSCQPSGKPLGDFSGELTP